MPTFLDGDNAPTSHDSTSILDLDPYNKLGPHAVKDSRLNGASCRRHPQANSVNEPFDEASYSSASDASDHQPMASNGNGTRPTSMSSLPNGKRLSVGSDSPEADHDAAVSARRLPNGLSTSLPDRTVPRQIPASATVNGSHATDKELPHLPIPNSYSEPSSSLPAAGHHVHHPPASPTSPRRSSEQSKPPLPTIPSDNETPSNAHAFPLPTSPSSESIPAKTSPHRLSSPPVYHSGASGSSSHLQPPHPGPTLKQRHTLEVPKLPPGRHSRDGMDTAQATGRYSPTTAGSGPRRASLSLARRATRSMQSDTPRDEIALDEDAVRWAEAYRQKRASKRKRKEEEEDEDRVVVGTKVDESHANWVTAYNMLTGIRVSVSRTNAKLDRDLTDVDFQAKQKSTFDM